MRRLDNPVQSALHEASNPFTGASQNPTDPAFAAVLPDSVLTSGTVGYYQHVMTIFKEKQVPEMMVAFAKYALNELGVQQVRAWNIDVMLFPIANAMMM